MSDWRRLIGDRGLSAEAVDELAQHLEDCFQAALARGGTEAEALKAVESELAGLRVDKRSLEIRTPRAGFVERLRQFIHIDLRDAFRRLRRSPGFSLLAIVVLAVGLGVNTAMFSLINAMLFKPLPVHAPEELVFAYYKNNAYYGGIPLQVVEELSGNTSMFRQLAGATSDLAWVTIDGRTEKLIGSMVTAGYFETLGVSAQVGRVFRADENTAGAPPALLISDAFWASRFHRDPAILGQTLRLSADQSLTERPGRDYTIIGVLPEGFNGTGSAASWLSPAYYVPIKQRTFDAVCVQANGQVVPRFEQVGAVGRLAPGVSFATVRDYVAQSSRGWEKEWFRQSLVRAGNGFELRQTRYARLPIDSAGNVLPERLATALIVVSGLLLLIAASNLVGIFMARTAAARTDTAIRLSLGAGRWRVARQHLTEGYLLAIAGCAGGFAIAAVLTKFFVAYLPASQFGSGISSGVPVSVDIPFDMRVILFAAAICAIVGTIVGLGPARQASKTDVLSALQLAAAPSAKTRKGLRHWIVVPQIALALVLLLVTGAVSRTVIASEVADPGYVPAGLIAVEFQLPSPDRCGPKPNWEEVRRRKDELVQKIGNLLPRLPSVESAAVSSFLPHETNFVGNVIAQDRAATGQHQGVRLYNVSPDYFETMKIPIVAGRGFTDADAQTGNSREPGAFVISRRLAESLWPGQSPIGRLLARHEPGSTFPSRWTEIVGVADDVLPPLHNGYAVPTLYLPNAPGSLVDRVVARAKSSEADAIREITAAVTSADPLARVVSTGTVAEGIGRVRFARRLAMVILGGAALIGLVLAAIGLYGVISYALSQRLREFGIRAALGASYRDLVRLVLKEALIVAAIGSAIGLAAAYSAIGLISSKLVAIPSVNIAIVIAGPAIVFMAVALACYLPARRAAKVDPLIVLRGL